MRSTLRAPGWRGEATSAGEGSPDSCAMRPGMLFLTTLLLAMLGQAGQDAPKAFAQPLEPAVTATRQHAFIIPFRIEPARSPQEAPMEVQLHVSSDQGVTWTMSEQVKPDKGQFIFRAPHDGEYWYAIRTVDGQGIARPPGQLQAQLKVVVDTVAPRLDLTAQRGRGRRDRGALAGGRSEPQAGKLQARIPRGPTDPWESVAVDMPPSAMRHISIGEATWWPKVGSETINMRAAITDAAGNPAVSQAVVTMPSTSSANTATTAANPFNSGIAPDTAAATNADASWRGAPSTRNKWRSQRNRRPQRPSRRTVSQVVRDPTKPSPLDFNMLPAGERPQMVGSDTFELEYEIDQVGPSGVAKVELWGTLDGGRTWTLYGRDADNLSPVQVKVEKEGIYGFRIVVQSGIGMGGQPPAAGDLADVWIGVDLADPRGRITAAEVNDDGSELVITWEASDDALDLHPVSLEFAATADGPWTPIASGLENSGSYTLAGRKPRAASRPTAHGSARRSRQRRRVRLAQAGRARPHQARRPHPRRPPAGPLGNSAVSSCGYVQANVSPVSRS